MKKNSQKMNRNYNPVVSAKTRQLKKKKVFEFETQKHDQTILKLM